MRRVLVTGGAGFIGSCVVRHLIAEGKDLVINVDKLTYAATPTTLASVESHPNYRFERADICDGEAIARIFQRHEPDLVMHLAAESHVDRSIERPAAFIETNILGTHVLLETARAHWSGLEGARKETFIFQHISTDEVFGSLGPEGKFTESTAYRPNSPYSASKASSDHLVRAWHKTYGLPVIVTNCSNNYGPYQFPEKLIPLTIIKALLGEELPVYGKGDNIRDWLYVEDHARALTLASATGVPGETYNFGGECEKTNLEVVEVICDILDDLRPRNTAEPRRNLIQFVTDRPGHDFRYAIDTGKARRDLGWAPAESFESGLRKTVEWYLENDGWWREILRTGYAGDRLGLGSKSDEELAVAQP